jgi:hypothetical protein
MQKFSVKIPKDSLKVWEVQPQVHHSQKPHPSPSMNKFLAA